jgi:ABC-type nitrate/sulfonate/bicarbonate transport system permease component
MTILTIVVIVGVWTVVTSLQVFSPLLLPSPQRVWAAFVELSTTGFLGHTLYQDLGLSLERVGLGFLSGTIVGTLLGIFMGTSASLNAFVNPLLQFFRPLPPLSYLVLIIVVFGIGEFPMDLVLFLSALPVAAIAARAGVMQTPIVRIQAAQSLGATPRDVFFRVVLPSALPEIFTGLRLAIGVVYSTIIAAEIIAGADGVGFLIYEAGSALRTDFVFVGIIVLGIFGLVLYAALQVSERKIVHWAGKG